MNWSTPLRFVYSKLMGYRTVVFRSETMHDNLNPYWKKDEVSLEALCYGKLDWPLKITVFDWQKNGKHRIIGQSVTSIAELQSNVAKKGNADRTNAIPLKKENKVKTNGLLVVLKFDIVFD